MKKYRVYLDELTSGTVDVEAETKEEAERKALYSLGDADWSDEGNTSVCDVVELNEDGREIRE